jgi:S-adenosylmethionine:tRNA ribosyltransferase-isomerase
VADILDQYMAQQNVSVLKGDTSIMITPGYRFKFCQGIITNFHQPKSTLLLLISAFIGDNWRGVYQKAIEENFRFLSYGDSSILLP